jgi:hypothetical protein
MNKNDSKDVQPLIEALARGNTVLYEIEEAKWVELERYYFSAPIDKYRIIERKPVIKKGNSSNH